MSLTLGKSICAHCRSTLVLLVPYLATSHPDALIAASLIRYTLGTIDESTHGDAYVIHHATLHDAALSLDALVGACRVESPQYAVFFHEAAYRIRRLVPPPVFTTYNH